jgi:hypothetical protein
MKRLLPALLALPLFPTLSLASSPFDGTWVTDMGSAKLPDKPDVYVVEQGWYECNSFVPSYRVKAHRYGQEGKAGGPAAACVTSTGSAGQPVHPEGKRQACTELSSTASMATSASRIGRMA